MDLAPYFARLALLLPLLCAIMVGGLLLARKYLGVGVGGGRTAPNAARVTQTLLLGPGARLAVVEFADRRLLLAFGKSGITTLADAPFAATPTVAPSTSTSTSTDPLASTPFGMALAKASRVRSTPLASIRTAASRFARANAR